MEILLSFGGLGIVALLAAISPGPDFLIVSKNALSHSRTSGVWTALGVGSALLVHTAYTIIGIGLIISQSILLFSVIKILGAVYLIWLGAGLLWKRGSHDIQLSEGRLVTEKSNAVSFREGFLTNVLNPKATVFFVSIFTQFVSPTLPVSVQAVYGIEVAVIVAMWFVVLSAMLTLSPVRNRISKVQDKIMQIMGVALIALGIKVAFEHR